MPPSPGQLGPTPPFAIDSDPHSWLDSSGGPSPDAGLGLKFMKILRLLALMITLGIGALTVPSPPPGWGGQEAMTLSRSDQEQLLKLARNTIRAHLRGESVPPVTGASGILCQPRGVFVSLHRQGQLRGCIGCLEAVKPLVQAVQEMAAAAAFHDPRFRPLRDEELADLEVEISILTPMRLIDKIEDIKVGTHGLYVELGYCRGLLLPQVAVEYRWDRNTFLEQTCGKAGLPADAWKDPAIKIYTFTAEIIGDDPKKAGTPRQESKSP
jgi:AmmeMemoRadiSam system protein A